MAFEELFCSRYLVRGCETSEVVCLAMYYPIETIERINLRLSEAYACLTETCL